MLNHHAGYDAKNVLSAKAQAQFSYYFTHSVGLHAGVYYLRHFQTPELTDARLGFAAAYLPAGDKGGAQPSLVQRSNACNCDISSVGAFAGVSIQLPKRKRNPHLKKIAIPATIMLWRLRLKTSTPVKYYLIRM
ncbi:hypothetical protein LWM68_43205 [Niabella sp. W65]|nr:hypothetical protein [Niabella sp. W65]MCH7368947.1 hypothetical protein [Niabella sp. W65]